MSQPSPVTLVRFETARGEGFFGAASYFLDMANRGWRGLRCSPTLLREMQSLLHWLNNNMSPPRDTAYKDDRSRSPCTWFKSSAKEHIRKAERLCKLLNQQGVDIWRIEQAMPIRPLWEDDIQVITRRPRSSPPQKPHFFKARILQRVNKQVKRRQRVGRIKARAAKSSI